MLVVGEFIEVIKGAVHKGGQSVQPSMDGAPLTYSFNKVEKKLARLPLGDGDVYLKTNGQIKLGELEEDSVLLAKIKGRVVKQYNKSDVYAE